MQFQSSRMVAKQGGHIKQPGTLLSNNRSIKCTTGASLRVEEKRFETKRQVSGQLTAGDKFKETRKLLKNVCLKQRGEESCSQIGHQEKKEKHILLRELTSWTPKFHWHIMRGMMQGGREEREVVELTEEGERKHYNINIMLFFLTVFKSSSTTILSCSFLFFLPRPQRMLWLFLSQLHIKLSSTPCLLSKTWHRSLCF